jgi:hypothetical protein
VDKIEGEILPEPELNPLLNPLLSAHMGRWAEVYFTTPPERRPQAVSDLVRELRRAPPPQSSLVPPVVEKNQEAAPTAEPKIFSSEPLRRSAPQFVESTQTCSECSAENPSQQKFCGMCGALLQSPAHDGESKSSAAPPLDNSREQKITDQQEEAAGETRFTEPERLSVADAVAYRRESTLNFGGYAASRSVREQEWSVAEADLPHFAVESESVPYRYRLYIGIAVALILGALLYMAWRGKSNSSGDTSESVPARVMPAAPPRAAPISSPAAAPQRASQSADQASDTMTARTASRPTSSRPSAGPSPRPMQPPTDAGARTQAAASPASPVARKSQAATLAAEKERVPSAASAPANSSASVPQSGVPQSSGAEELDIAEKYLNGSRQGYAGDNREAAQWLWKSVGKGNLTATMILSDLYLRGDGIPKNCDQARLLLNVAARKGKASAGERLRNLQAFGCQ